MQSVSLLYGQRHRSRNDLVGQFHNPAEKKTLNTKNKKDHEVFVPRVPSCTFVALVVKVSQIHPLPECQMGARRVKRAYAFIPGHRFRQTPAGQTRAGKYVRLKWVGRVAQVVEQRPFKAWVAGSNPAALTNLRPESTGPLARALLFCPQVLPTEVLRRHSKL